MADHIYKHIELTGSSRRSIEDAVTNAVTRAAQTVRKMRWLEVVSTRAHIEDNAIAHWQVTIKIGFTLEDEGAEPVPLPGPERNAGRGPRSERRMKRARSGQRRR